MGKPISIFFFILLASYLAIANSAALAQSKPVAPLKLLDFAYAVPLIIEGEDALYQTQLPQSVYQNTLRSDLGDLRVFNAQGEMVPHRLHLPEHSSNSPGVFSKLVFFPLSGPASSGLEQLSLHIKHNDMGTLVDLGSKAKSGTQPTLSGYLIDASKLKQTIQALELDWKIDKDNFVGSLNIESSDDLKHWAPVLSDAPLASMQFDGHSLLQKRVEFPPLKAKYLRLSWPQQQAPLQLTVINAVLSPTRIDTPLAWLTASGSAVADKVGEYAFDLGAHLPLQRVRILLPQMNTLVQAALFSRARPEDSWQLVNSIMLYKMRQLGQELRNPDITVATNQRYWLLRVEQKNGGLGSGVPEIQVGWQSHQLQFVTRGAAPFLLAYGSREVQPAEFQIQNLLPTNTQDHAKIKIPPAQTGAQQTLGGEARLRATPASLPWKKWSLWAVLGIAVVLLGWMAYRLVKQMERHE